MISTITKRHGFVSIDLISKELGRQMIIENHYSHKNVNTSKYYLGCFIEHKLVGVASFGCAMNAIPTTKIVTGSSLNNYLELNRLWIKDGVGNNIETVFLGLCWSWIRKHLPEVKWIQSFADGRVGVGTIYQAANFIYCGYHISKFWKDTETNIVYHNSILTRKTRKKYYELEKRKDKLESFNVKTYRYIYFLDKKWKKNLTLESKSYPKLDN